MQLKLLNKLLRKNEKYEKKSSNLKNNQEIKKSNS